MSRKQIIDNQEFEKVIKIYRAEFNGRLNGMVKRALELPVSYVRNAPLVYLGEATECFIHGFFNASIALSRATLEQVLKHKLGIDKDEAVRLPNLIEKASSRGILDSTLRGEAIRVQKWGNVYIHDTEKKDSQHAKQKRRSKEVLLSTKKVIEALYPQ